MRRVGIVLTGLIALGPAPGSVRIVKPTTAPAKWTFSGKIDGPGQRGVSKRRNDL
jgi:hypothetical protein